MKTQPLANFLGLNNRLPDTELSIRTRQVSGQYLRAAENIDIDNAGNARSRSATKLIQALTGAHSLHMVTDTTGYVAQDVALYPLTVVDEVVTLGALIKVLSNSDPLSWCAVGDDLYYSNGADSGRLAAGVWYPLGIATPEAPALGLVAGSLHPGWYQVGVSYSNSVTGEESGISASSNAELEAEGGIRVTLPGATVGADTVNVYLSHANGAVVYHKVSLPVATVTYDCTTLATGRESAGRFEDPLPAGALFMSNGRLCSFKGGTVYIGLPWRHGYYLPAEGYLQFPSPVTVAVENQGGTYIVADKTHWFPGGDLASVEATITDVLPFGAVPGTVFQHPTDPKVGWFSTKGVVLADMNGAVSPLTADMFDMAPPASGTAVVFDEEYRRVVSCGYCVNLDSRAMTRYTGWDFTSVSGDYGTKPDGIYLLNCDGLVESIIDFGKINFGSEELKRLPAVYAGMASESPLELTVAYVDERDTEQSYDFLTRGSSTNMQIQRFDTAKGMRANWFNLSLSNTDGAYFKLASVSFAPTASTRRI